MTALMAVSFILLVYAIGDMVATRTRAVISMILVCSVIFLAGFWCGLPADIFDTSGLSAFAGVTICMFLVHIGSTIRIVDFIKEWKTVVVVLVTTLAIAFGTYFICRLIMDKYYALAGSPCLAGGMVAYFVMQAVGDRLGRNDVTVFALMILCCQAFAGVPIASSMCKKEGTRILKEWKAGRYTPVTQDDPDLGPFGKFRIFPSVPERYNSSNLILFKIAILAVAAQQLAVVTGVNQLIFALVLGVIFHEIGLLDEAALTKANGFSFVMAGALCTMFSGLASTTPQMIGAMLLNIIELIVIGIAVAAIVSILIGKLVGFSPSLSLAVAITALFGFPGTFLISREVSAAVGQTQEEIDVVMSYIMPKMIIAGIVSVSVVSGLAASVMCTWV